ncbi:PAS domain S-box-containing protein/diguanylate cyclase (GGDEF)-like protein [Ilumatobacter fluminis]|uniref:PAS domain S-box-containing protein/diguanylate cyclase (GGDEF)-like protein n=1 Tax=Ilumatobacter fluminis TaxID=467091 RepID=A0A4R7I0J6_9ACTN|nr:PAS domain S-box protein [Ilumatobacter fluminis]TDT15963.1 PAS domain S-box-containing protein/diguanylate cyclase (GGDEF)-like protein [Ilumatobacter fluminis]
MPDEASLAGPDRSGPLAGQWLGLAVLEHLPAAVWLKDLDGRYLGCNEAFGRYFGAPESEIVGRVDVDFVDEQTAALFRQQDRLAMSSDRPVSNEEWVVSATDRSRMLWETTKRLLRDDRGNPIGVLGVAFDITERARDHQALEERSDALDEAERLAHIGSWSVDIVAGTTTWSTEMYRILGVQPGVFEPSADSIRSVLHPADAEAFDHAVAEAARERRAFAVEHRIVVGDEVRHVEHRGRFDHDEFGVVVRQHGTLQDITERVRETRRAERFARLVDRAADAVALIDVETGRLIDCNQKACDEFGGTREQVLALHAWDLVEDVSDWLWPAIADSVNDSNRPFRCNIRRLDQTIVPTEAMMERFDDDGRDVIVAAARDISDRVERERLVRESAQQFEALVRSAKDGFAMTDADGQILDVNGEYCAQSGFARSDLIGRSFVELDELTTPADALARRDRIKATGGQIFQTVHRRADGSTWPVEVSVSYGPMSGGRFFAFFRDLTERRRNERELRRSAERWNTLLEGTHDGFVRLDGRGVIVEVNQNVCHTAGVAAADVVGRSVAIFDRGLDADGVEQMLTRARTERTIEFATHIGTVGGSSTPVEISLTFDAGGGGQYFAFVRDVSERAQLHQEAIVAAERYRALLAGSNDGFARVALDGTIREVNQRLARMLGRSEADLIGTSIDEHDVDGDASDYILELVQGGPVSREFVAAHARRADGSEFPVEIDVGYSTSDGGEIFAFVRDVTERVEAERRIEFLAYNDPLTSLPNRAGFSHLLADAVDRADRSGTFVAVCYLDLDGFKPVNDRYGHEMGDAVLVRFADRLRATIRSNDAVARFGGDEFVVLIEDLDSIEQVHEHARRLVAACETPLAVGGRRIHLSASVGITVSPADDGDEDVLLRHADQAMYRAKARGKNTYELFDPVVDSELQHRRDELEEFEQALDRDELVLHFQPRIDLATGEPVAVEALVRWQHPTRGLLLPGEFLPVIDATPLEFALDEWVLRAALDQLAEWDRAGLTLGVSVNVSPRHIAKPSFPEYLASQLRRYRHGLAERLELEIVETAAVGQLDDVAEIMERCASLGVTFSLDDFGTGYSSLTHFSSLPVNVLKIDQGFVRRLMNDARNLDIVEGVVQLAKALGRPVVAEGVESVEIGMLLRQLDCQYAQGFGIALPMESAAIPRWVTEFRAGSSWRDVADGPPECSRLRDLDVARHVHGQWIDQVLEFTRGASSAEQPRTSLDQCPLLDWYHGAAQGRYGELAAFGAVVRDHERMHELGAELVLASAGGGCPSESDLREFTDAAGRFSRSVDDLLSEAAEQSDD